MTRSTARRRRFAAPVVEVLDDASLRRHPVLRRLGPDLCDPTLDLDEVLRRLAVQDPGRALGEVLLDQTVVCGIGNVYRCDVAFLQGIDPRTPLGSVSNDEREALYTTAADLLRHNLDVSTRTTVAGAPPGSLWVYGRGGEPCRNCGTAIAVGRLGTQNRVVYWCPDCQPLGRVAGSG